VGKGASDYLVENAGGSMQWMISTEEVGGFVLGILCWKQRVFSA